MGLRHPCSNYVLLDLDILLANCSLHQWRAAIAWYFAKGMLLHLDITQKYAMSQPDDETGILSRMPVLENCPSNTLPAFAPTL